MNRMYFVLQGKLSDELESSNSVFERKGSGSGKSNHEEKPKLFSKNRASSLTSPTKRSTLAKLTNSCSSETKRAP